MNSPAPEASLSPDSATRVIAAVISNGGGEVLICQRPLHKRHGGLWEFPGGKIESGETPFGAASRELEEELGVEVISVGDLRLAVRDTGSPFIIEFYPVAIRGLPRCLEHAALEWVRTAELPTRVLAPSDRKFADFLLSGSDPVDSPTA